MHSLSDYRFHLPGEKIAQYPAEKRDQSRLLCLDKQSGAVSHLLFREIDTRLKAGDVLVINNTKVVPARLTGKKSTGGKAEVLLIDYARGMAALRKEGVFRCDCLVRASRPPRPGTTIRFEPGGKGVVTGGGNGIFTIAFTSDEPFPEFIMKHGDLPLPPYIKREKGQASEKDRENYQTVYAQKEGAVAAPTAGRHFTDTLIRSLEKKGVEFVPITLHVGYGTFVPVRVADIRDHRMHPEYFSVDEAAASRINRAKAENRRIVAVGTTSVRTLEYIADETGTVRPGSGVCDLFIYPGFTFQCVDALVTNFHLPESTLLMLVSAFAGREKVLSAYRCAVEQDYRFFSYGDAMMIA